MGAVTIVRDEDEIRYTTDPDAAAGGVLVAEEIIEARYGIIVKQPGNRRTIYPWHTIRYAKLYG